MEPQKAVVDPNAPLTMGQVMALFSKMVESNNAQFQEALKTIVSEIRKPPVDPVKEISAARAKATKEASLKQYWESKANKKKGCSHMREDGTSNIAWATQSDGIERGMCPYCQSDFTPADGELYARLRLIPRGRKDNVRHF